MCVCVRAFACLLACVPICVRTYRSIRVHIRADAEFVGQNTDGDESRIMGYFGTPPQDVTSSQDIDLAAFISDLADQVDHWNARGSGFVIDRIINSCCALANIDRFTADLRLSKHPITSRTKNAS